MAPGSPAAAEEHTTRQDRLRIGQIYRQNGPLLPAVFGRRQGWENLANSNRKTRND
jgi:hypothetical protein